MPILLYNLELTEEEMITLWVRLTMLEIGSKLDENELPILEKLQRLMEGQ